MKFIGETLYLPITYAKVFFFNYKEEKKVQKLYSNILFQKADFLLKQSYLGKNPYKTCKRFMEEKGNLNVHVYGETPLTQLHDFLQLCKIKKTDCFIDLGSGRGRSALFVSSFFGCKAIGIDLIPSFCKEAQKIADTLNLKSSFRCEDMLISDLQGATFIYFYALCLEETLLRSMIERLSFLSKGTNIITVSFPLSDYSSRFATIFSKQVSYPWGKTELFLNRLKTNLS